VLETEDVLEELNLPALRGPAISSTKTGTAALAFSEEERRLLSSLGTEPVHLDALSLLTGHDTSELLVLLFELELKKAVVQLPGQFFCRNR